MKIDAPVIRHDGVEVTLTYRFREGIPDGWYILHDGREFHFDSFDLILQQIKEVPNVDDLCRIPREIATSIGWQKLRPPKEGTENIVTMADIDEDEMISTATHLKLLREQIRMLIRHLGLNEEEHIL